MNPFVGTSSGAPDFGTGGGAGATFPGAVVPFGMVQFSPDTLPGADNFAAGYSYRDRLLRGFSLTHFSGAGCAIYGDIPLLPIAGAVTASPAVPGSSDIQPRYVPSFDHRHERASPGSYAVTLEPGSVRRVGIELTATTRTGDARITFPERRPASILIGAGGSSLADYAADVRVDPGHAEVSGSVESGNFCFQRTRYRVYFDARFDHRFSATGTWRGQHLMPSVRTASASNPSAFAVKGIPGQPPIPPGAPSTGVQVGAYVGFDTGRSRTVEARVGLSFTSAAAARRNLAAEALGNRFARLREAAVGAWHHALSKVIVGGGSPRERSLLYTALYHALIEPSTYSDADGGYLGMDGRAHRAGRATQYANVSGWDVYRTQIPLLAMLDPSRADDLVTSLIRDAEQSGCLPRWPYANQQTNVQTGDPSDLISAAAHAFGAHGFSAEEALRWMVSGADRPCHTRNGDYTEREGLADYQQLGYVPQDDDTDAVGHTFAQRTRAWGAAATTLEDALADSAISELADSLGEHGLARRFAARSRSWERLFDPSRGYIRPRYRSGVWLSPFAPTTTTGFVEGNAAQYTWFVPQNIRRLFALLGGVRVADRRLDRFFSRLNAGPAQPYAFLGNEPTLGVPWLYDWLGRPSRASDIVHRALLGLYSPTPAGMPGNDDGGTLSAWWVLASLGIYPAVPGTDVLALNAPLFSRVSINLRRGVLAIDAPGLSRARRYVQSATLDGVVLKRSRLRFSRLLRGRHRLRLTMGANPNSGWAAAVG